MTVSIRKRDKKYGVTRGEAGDGETNIRVKKETIQEDGSVRRRKLR